MAVVSKVVRDGRQRGVFFYSARPGRIEGLVTQSERPIGLGAELTGQRHEKSVLRGPDGCRCERTRVLAAAYCVNTGDGKASERRYLVAESHRAAERGELVHQQEGVRQRLPATGDGFTSVPEYSEREHVARAQQRKRSGHRLEQINLIRVKGER